MGFYLHRIPSLIQKIFPNHIWKISNTENKIYLTFDDGPTPEVTDYVLDTLAKYHAQATFFCLGQNVAQYSGLLLRTIKENHQLGNHGFEHLDGWKVSKEECLLNVSRGEEAIRKISETGALPFRPPYGHFRTNPSAVLWSLMSGDFDADLSKEKCLSLLIAKTRSGDIIVFHDNEKSFEKLKWVLPQYLKYLVSRGYQFGLISENR